MFIDLLNWLTFIWLALWTLFAIRQLMSGNRQAILYLLIVHFALNGTPLLLDELWGQPDYSRLPGFYFASRDDKTAVIYCLYVSAIPVFWWLIGRHRILNTTALSGGQATEEHILAAIRRFSPIFLVLLVSPLIALALAPEPGIYLTYAWVATRATVSPEMSDYHEIIVFLCTLSLLSAMGLFAVAPRLRISHYLFLFPWVALAVWLNGKRHLFVFAVALIWYVLYWKGRFLLGSRFVLAGLLLITSVVTFSYAYQETVRGIGFSGNIDELYEDFRINYGRDDVIKMTIYAELYPATPQILEYRGQSLVFYAAQYVRRHLWPDKPFPYAQYFTCALLHIPPRLLGWGMTTSWLEEAIANFGWFGLVLGPLLPAMICRIGDENANALVYPLTILVSELFLSVQLAAFAPIFYIWIIIVLWNKQLVSRKMGKESTGKRTFRRFAGMRR